MLLIFKAISLQLDLTNGNPDFNLCEGEIIVLEGVSLKDKRQQTLPNANKRHRTPTNATARQQTPPNANKRQ